MADFDGIKKVFSEQLGIDESVITPDTKIVDLGADSLDLVEAMMNIEEEFNTQFDDGALENFKTIGDIMDYINETR